MASNPTVDSQEDIGADGNSTEGEGDKGRGKEGKPLARIIMNSKVVQKVSGKRRYSGGVTPAHEIVVPQTHMKAGTPKTSSDPKHHPQSEATGKGHKKDSSASAKQQVIQHQPMLSSHQQQQHQHHPPHATGWFPTGAHPHQPDHTHLKEEKKGEGHSDDTQLIRQYLRKIELEKKRLEKDKASLQNQVSEYEEQLAEKGEQLQQLQSARVRAGSLPQMVAVEGRVREMTEKQTKLEMSLITRDTQVIQLTAEKDLLEQQLQEAQEKSKLQDSEIRRLVSEKQQLLTEKSAATHQVEVVLNRKTLMEKEIHRLTEQLTTEKKQEQALSSREQQLQEVKMLREKVAGMTAEKKASEEATRKQFRRLQDHYEQELRSAREEVDKAKKQRDTEIESKKIHQLRQELQDFQSQLLEKDREVTVLCNAKRLLQVQLKEENQKKDAELTEVQTPDTELEGELQQVKERLQQKQSELERAEQFMESVTTLNMSLEDENHDLKQQLQKLAEHLTRRLDQKDAAIKRASDEFEQLKKQHIKIVQTMSESVQNANAQQHEIEELKREITKLQDELAFTQAQCQRLGSNYQMENTRANRVQEELDQLRGQYRELGMKNTQLKSSNQVLQGRLRDALQQLPRHEEEKRQLQHQLEGQRQYRLEAEGEVERLRMQVMEVTKSEGREEQSLWVVRREEVMMSRDVVGSGGWGEVKVAMFRGLRVVAKILHRAVISEFNVQQFHREMAMAAIVRHPNLLQFIGAVTEGTPIILTELMPTNLRSQLDHGRLPRDHILSISRDVSLALNYLHLFRPDPIIHRDISSPNVLLEPIPTGWRAKVSDFGSANFRSHTTTAGPGNPVYSAPESRFPDDHSPKMDVFSFGVLLIEMVLHQPPGTTTTEKNRQVSKIQWVAMSSLIRHCLSQSPFERPNMEYVLTALRNMSSPSQ